MTVIIILGVLFALLLFGVPVALALGSIGLGMLFFADLSPLIAPQGLLSALDGFILLAVPLFLLMSNVLLKGGVGGDLYAAVQAWVGHWPGGLAVATVISCGLFAAISGSSVATAATIGTVAIPEMINRGYDKKFVYGLLAAGGTLGILIPPSIPMIVYGFVTEESVIALFLAGIGPGLFLLVMFCVYSMAYAAYHGMGRSEKTPMAKRLRATLRIVPSMSLAAVVVGGIYTGIFTPTEAAAIGFAASVVLTAFVLRTLTWKGFKEAAVNSMATTVAVLMIVACAKVFGKAIALYRIPQDLSAFISDTVSGPAGFVILVAVVLVLMGLVLEALSMVLIMTPVLLPAALGLAIDPIWFGIFIVLMVEAALITPPVGLNLYVIQSVARASLTDVARGALPFLGLMIICVVVLYLLPDLALYLPFKL